VNNDAEQKCVCVCVCVCEREGERERERESIRKCKPMRYSCFCQHASLVLTHSKAVRIRGTLWD